DFELTALLFDLSEQPGILNGESGLSGECLEQRDLLGRKCSNALTHHDQRTDQPVLGDKRYGKECTQPDLNEHVHDTAFVSGGIGDVLNLYWLAGLGNASDRALALSWAGIANLLDIGFGQVPARPKRELLGRLVVLVHRAAIRSGELDGPRHDRIQHGL